MGVSVHQNGTLYLSSKEAGRLSGYTSDYVARLARQGKVAATRVGTQWFVQPESLDTFLKSAELAKADRKNKLRLERLGERGQTSVQADAESSLTGTAAVSIEVAVHSAEVEYDLPHSYRAHAKSFVAVVCGLFLAVAVSSAQFLDLSRLQTVALAEGRLTAYGFYQLVSAPAGVTQLLSAVSVNSFSETPSSVTVAEVSPLEEGGHEGIIVFPSDVATATIEQVQDSFSDEVTVDLDAGGVTGTVTPQFKEGPGEQYRFVLVPVDSPP